MVKAIGTHFEYEDGTYYYPFGTTIYALAHQSKELIDETMATLKKSPFNKVRMCVFPKHYQYNNNEPLYYPFGKRPDGSWDTGKPVKEFWDNLENVIRRLDEMEIQCDLILFHSYDNWGFATMGREDNLKYLEYCLKRLGDLDNVWWSLANEYDLLLSEISMDGWREIEEFVAAHNPRGHLLSNHNCFLLWDVSRPNITHGSYQIKYLANVARDIKKFNKPVCVDECCYEGNLPEAWGNLSAEEMTARFWQAIASGGYCTHGETFLDDQDIVWWAKGGILKGKSPERIRFLRDITEELPSPLAPYEAAPFEFMDNLPDEVKANFEKTPAGRSFGMAIAQQEHDADIIMSLFEHQYTGRSEDQSVILNYLYLRCQAFERMTLPEGRNFKVEVIDTWNMTRLTAFENAHGKIRIDLPGRPYMAILATEVKE
jgi:hypothetical protein